MNLKQPQKNAPVSPRVFYASQFTTATTDLIIFSAFTLINIVLLFAQANVSFTFSAFLPEILVAFGLGFQEALGNSMPLILSGVVAVVFVAGCLVSALLAKKHPGWLTLGTVLVCIDTAFLAYFIVMNTAIIADLIWYILFHAWILFNLFRGHKAISALKNLPPEPQTYDVPYTEVTSEIPNAENNVGYTLNGDTLPPDDSQP